jgi:hypothetical protein
MDMGFLMFFMTQLTHLSIFIGREVVFQCRDEGPIRARVRWVRGNGQPLPPDSRDVSGRLEIPNIRVSFFFNNVENNTSIPTVCSNFRLNIQENIFAKQLAIPETLPVVQHPFV